MHYGKGESHGIPYRCLTPKGLKNVLVAGRSISAEQMVQGSTRVMPCCLAMAKPPAWPAAHASSGMPMFTRSTWTSCDLGLSKKARIYRNFRRT